MKLINLIAVCSIFLCVTNMYSVVYAIDSGEMTTHDKKILSVQKKYRQGSHFMRIDPSIKTQSSEGRVEVIELFLYNCPHCLELEPKLDKWLSRHPEVDFIRIPAILAPTWSEMAKFYYTAEKLGVLDKLHTKLYQAIHTEGKQFYSELAIRHFFLRHGVSALDYENAYFSKEVLAKTNKARRLSVLYNMRGVPAIIVNGKYKTAPFFVKSQEDMLELLDQLVLMESQAGEYKPSKNR